MTLTNSDVDDDVDDEEQLYKPIETLEDGVRRLLDLKEQASEISNEILFVENWIDHQVKETDSVQLGFNNEGEELFYRVTPVRSKTTTVNSEGLQRMAPEVAKKVIKTETVEKVDVEALTRQIELGNLPVQIMRQVISQKPKKTSIRLTPHTRRDDEEESIDDE